MLYQFYLLPLFTLLSLVMADEALSASTYGEAWKYGSGGGIIGFIILILDIIVFIEVLRSNRPPSQKLLWCVVVFLFPVLGLVLYWVFSDRHAHMGSGTYEAIP